MYCTLLENCEAIQYVYITAKSQQCIMGKCQILQTRRGGGEGGEEEEMGGGVDIEEEEEEEEKEEQNVAIL